MRGLGLGLLLVAACGRIGYDEHGCPEDTTELAAGASTCIEYDERGRQSWTDAKATCEQLGRRLCSDAEWLLACTEARGLVEMTDDEAGADWEWVADESGGVAKKRGYDACSASSAHEIFTDPYDFRCCVDTQ